MSSYVGGPAPAPSSAISGLTPLLQRADELGASVRSLSFISPRPGHDICNVAEVKGASLVLLGWHKPVLSGNVLGGTVREVLANAPMEVAVLIDRGLTQLRRILVLYHGTPHDLAAVQLAQRIYQASAGQASAGQAGAGQASAGQATSPMVTLFSVVASARRPRWKRPRS